MRYLILAIVMMISISTAQALNLSGPRAVPPSTRTTTTDLNDPPPTCTRRSMASISAAIATTLIVPQVSNAAPPMSAMEADGLAAQIERRRRNPPQKLLRPTLNLDFAVLLMRSSYNAMDELDCVPMDQFQRDFFFIRQGEYQPYINSLGPGMVKQGDLTDPYYFDFISFAQYATIFRDITIDPPVVFEEQQPIIVGEDEQQQFVSRIIRRDAALLDNSLLPGRHDALVGDTILDKLNELFGTTSSAIPSLGSDRSIVKAEGALASIQQLVNLFLINGYAFSGTVVLKKAGRDGDLSGSQFEICLTAPANLWSGRALQWKRAFPQNDFVLKTLRAFLRRSGFQISNASVKYTSSQEIATITIS